MTEKVEDEKFLEEELVAEASFGLLNIQPLEDCIYFKMCSSVAHRKVSDYFQNKGNIDKANGLFHDFSASNCTLGRENIKFDSGTGSITANSNQFHGSYGL